MNAEAFIDVVAADKKDDIKSRVKDLLYNALDAYCAGKIKYWNNKMDRFVQERWYDLYLNNFEGEYDRAVFDEIIALKQRQLDPNEYI